MVTCTTRPHTYGNNLYAFTRTNYGGLLNYSSGELEAEYSDCRDKKWKVQWLLILISKSSTKWFHEKQLSLCLITDMEKVRSMIGKVFRNLVNLLNKN